MQKNIKFIVCSLFAIMLLSSNYVFAEHQKAQEYREILASDKYLIEYTVMDENKNEDLKIGKILIRDGEIYLTAEKILTSSNFGFWGSLEKKASYEPIAFYEDGRYYSFFGDDHALCVTEEIMKQRNYYTGIDWHNVLDELSAPDMLLPIMGYNKFNIKNKNILNPVYESSRTENIGNKEYNIDDYVSDVKNVAGVIMYKIKYSYYYNNELAWIRTSFVDKTGSEQTKKQIKINRIISELPDKMSKWKENIIVTDLGQGDINELLGNNTRKKVK